METTAGGIVYPSPDDLASANALRLFAESTGGRILGQNVLLDELEFAPYAILSSMSTETITASMGLTDMEISVDVATSFSGSTSDGLGFSFLNSGFPTGTYLIGACASWLTAGTVLSITTSLNVRDPRGPKATDIHWDQIQATTSQTSRGWEQLNPCGLFDIYAPSTDAGAYARLDVIISGSGNITKTTDTTLWVYRMRGLPNA